MTKEKERKIIDALVDLFLEDDDLDIYMQEQIKKDKLKHQSNNLD